MKKIVLLFTFLLTLALQARAQYVDINGMSYFLNEEGTATLIGGADRETVEIPAQVSYNGNNYAVTSIGFSAFKYCFSLTSVTIPNSVTSIGEDAFFGCSSLTSVTIPNSVTSIEISAFHGCSSLTSVTIPENVTEIANNAFCGCHGLTSVTIPNSVTSIGDFAFDSCYGLTSITIPESMTSIGNYAFRYCSGLTSVTIPESVTRIGCEAFWECTGLTSVTSLITEPFLIDRVFLGIAKSATLYVPKGTKAAYEATKDWTAYFANVVELGDDPSAILDLSASQAAGEDAVYNLNGVRVQQPTQQGVYIVNGKKVAMP